MADKQLVFIASGGRTGTQFLGDLLGRAIDDCWSEHESDMFAGFSRTSLARIRRHGLWHMTGGRALGRTGIRAAGTRLLSGKESFESVAARLRRERDPIYRLRPQGLIVDSYWRWWMFAGRVDRIWPGAKTALVIRDPASWIASWAARSPRHASRHWTSRFPPGPLSPGLVGDLQWSPRWKALDTVGRLAWEWNEIYRRIDEAAECGRDCRLFRFEDLFGDRAAMESLVDFVRTNDRRAFAVRDFDLLDQPRRNASAAIGNEWRGWSSANRRLVDELCAPLMRKHGYPLLAEREG